VAIIVGFLIYTGSMRLNLAAFFRWTGLFILVVAAGILANSVQALHEAGVWNHLQSVLFDVSASLPMDGPLGSVLAGMFGYQDAPTLSTLGAYVLYLGVTLVLFFLPGGAPAKAPGSASSVSSQ
ncbi:FTR1 family protein, partial [Pseudomonas protegens]